MSETKFPSAALVERCASEAVRALMKDNKPLWVFLADNNRTAEDLYAPIRVALRASGHGKLVAALVAIRADALSGQCEADVVSIIDAALALAGYGTDGALL